MDTIRRRFKDGSLPHSRVNEGDATRTIRVPVGDLVAARLLDAAPVEASAPLEALAARRSAKLVAELELTIATLRSEVERRDDVIKELRRRADSRDETTSELREQLRFMRALANAEQPVAGRAA
ncbi:hypothetical protein CWIS_04410 [Cellulomonas sp. A375-1]|nr:hypothetical protein CWIS_04410 [Cellulomonas sp. A375-1]